MVKQICVYLVWIDAENQITQIKSLFYILYLMYWQVLKICLSVVGLFL